MLGIKLNCLHCFRDPSTAIAFSITDLGAPLTLPSVGYIARDFESLPP